MQCQRCGGLGTVTLYPPRNVPTGEEAGQVIALCPACHGSGRALGLRLSVRRMLHTAGRYRDRPI